MHTAAYLSCGNTLYKTRDNYNLVFEQYSGY